MRLRAALVSYLNTKPFIEGFERFFSAEELEIRLLPPSACAPELLSKQVDFALIPVGSLVDFSGLHLMKDHCIGAEGKVDSVFLFSEVDIKEIEQVRLDPHSRSSNGLTRVLMANYWKRSVDFIQTPERDFSAIKGTTAGVAIGDRAYALRDQYPKVWDLSETWRAYTGLPFAFAVWAYWPERIEAPQLEKIRAALEWGRTQGKLAAHHWASEFGYTIPQAEKYLTETIRFPFDHNKHLALQRYFRELKALDAVQ